MRDTTKTNFKTHSELSEPSGQLSIRPCCREAARTNSRGRSMGNPWRMKPGACAKQLGCDHQPITRTRTPNIESIDIGLPNQSDVSLLKPRRFRRVHTFSERSGRTGRVRVSPVRTERLLLGFGTNQGTTSEVKYVVLLLYG